METGLDPPRIKIRAAQGLEAADFFLPGFWVWVSRAREGGREGGREGEREKRENPYCVTHTHSLTQYFSIMQARVIRDVAAIGYDQSNLSLQSYDWRLSLHTLTDIQTHTLTHTLVFPPFLLP